MEPIYLSIWDGRNWAAIEPLNTVKGRYDLEVAGIYRMLKVAPPGSIVELAIKTAGDFAHSDPRGDEPVVR